MINQVIHAVFSWLAECATYTERATWRGVMAMGQPGMENKTERESIAQN